MQTVPTTKVDTNTWIKKHPEAKEKYKETKRRKYKEVSGPEFIKRQEAQKAYTKAYYSKQRRIVLNGYGSKCACCGESEEAFLTIDHVKGGGSKERKRYSSWTILNNIIKSKFSKDYQLLCFNCNWAKYKLGCCPHQSKVLINA